MGTVAGIPVDPITGQPKSEEGLLALKKQEEEEAVGFDPLRAAALSAGASLLRNSGWRRNPMTLGEQIGHAIPAGMQAYYNQDALNQQEQQALYDRQQAEQQALDAKQQAEETADLEAQKFADFETLLKQAFPNDRTRQREFRSFYQTNPLEAHKALRALLKPKGDGQVEYKKGLGPEGKKMGWWAFKDGEKNWLGVSTGDVSQKEKFVFEQFKFGKEYDLEEKKFSLSELAQTNLDEYRKLELKRKKEENDQDYGLRLKQHEHTVIQAMIQNNFTESQIVNQAEQFRLKYDQDDKFFMKGQDLKLLIHNKKMDNWQKEFDEEVKVNGQNYQLASDTLENKIIQDGINNNFTAEKIANQVNQFREKQALSVKGLELKENIFKHQVENDELNFNENVRQFNSKLSHSFKVLEQRGFEHQDKVALQKAAQEQAIVEHLALIHQRGIENGFDADKIALEQEKFLESKGQFIQTHELNTLKHRATVENNSAKLAQQITEFIYKKGRDAKGDIRKDAKWKQDLREYEDKLIQQSFNNLQSIEGLQLKKDIFKADVELKKLKLATEGDQPPRTLTGQAAIAWANKQGENSPLNANRQGTPVIKLNKHGQFDSIEYLDQKQYDEEQRTFLTRSREKWDSDTEVKAANKIARLATSLKELGDSGTGVAEFAMIYKFMKSLDETSTVLASEFRNAREAGLSAWRALMLWGDKQYEGTQLDPKQKSEIIAAVRAVAHSKLSQMNDKQKTYLADAVGIQKISREDAIKMYPNTIGDYFKKWPYKPKAKIPGATTEAIKENPVSSEIDTLP
jgi:hypothetical protein